VSRVEKVASPLLPVAWRIFVVLLVAGAAVLLVVAPWHSPSRRPDAVSVPPAVVSVDGVPVPDEGAMKPVDDTGMTAPHPLVRYEMPTPHETPPLAEGAADVKWHDLWAAGEWTPPTVNGFRLGTPGKDLFPDGSTPKDIELFFLDLADMRQMQGVDGTVNADLDGRRVRLAGYTTPVGFGEDERAFLLVPELGACIHVPPPSPNQIVLVPEYAGEAEMFAPVWVTGILRVDPQATILADVGYRMEDVTVEPYR
jgi:hypothetical protein